MKNITKSIIWFAVFPVSLCVARFIGSFHYWPKSFIDPFVLAEIVIFLVICTSFVSIVFATKITMPNLKKKWAVVITLTILNVLAIVFCAFLLMMFIFIIPGLGSIN